jgi:protein-disulfide isomerase
MSATANPPENHRPLDLSDPVSPHDHVRGPSSALVTLVEYGDFECPFCARAFPVVRALESRFAEHLRFVFRHNPRAYAHPHAPQAAEAGEAAADQGKFWEMHDMLFSHQNALEENDLIEYAKKIGLDVEKFTAALRSRVHSARVRADELGGVKSHVISTPTFFINGLRFNDKPDLDTLTAAIDAARRSAEDHRPDGLA